jgi:putative hydrolase of the HAD superfamily
MIKVISFDLDNTLWDVDEVMIRATKVQQDWLHAHRPRVTEQYDARSLFRFKQDFLHQNPQFRHQISELRIHALKAVQLAAGYSEQESEAGAREAFDLVLEARHDVVYYQHALETLATLARDYRLVALSNGNADVFRLSIGRFFHAAVRAEQYDTSKPDPVLFKAALTETGAKPEETIHVGDHPEHDVQGAQSVGMHTVWFNPEQGPWPGGVPANAAISALDELPATISTIETELSRNADPAGQ